MSFHWGVRKNRYSNFLENRLVEIFLEAPSIPGNLENYELLIEKPFEDILGKEIVYKNGK